ncbi:hypothetical protein RHGRI_006602 [Rhododendron griersonianum]|uniref:DDE Tnp4 domain-containing protein n=1 Tax=Rhododendron griersonianum TaxID=479676 RepID=A0AAV6KTR4_9ERIC|nr:hypothetical protein RHGRI_006602 [Rhododendron griersonianum]
MVSPRKRMNLGKKVAPTSSHRFGVVPPGAYRPGRANWDSQMTRLFLQLAIKEIEAEGKGTTQLSNNSLCNIAAEISARTGEVVNLKQCKDRYGVLMTLLADSRRGATGLGMNPVTGTFTAPDHFWANLIAQNESVAKFCDHPLEHEELMQRVFEEVTATGSLQCTPGAEGELGMGANGRRALATDNDDQTDTGGEGNTVGIENGEEIGSEYTSTSAEYGRGTPFCSQQGMSNPLFPQYGMGTTNPGCNSSGTKQRSTSSGTDALLQSMTNILETMISRQNQYRSVIKHGCNMVDIMKILGRMEYFQQEPVPPVYWWLIDYLSGDPMKMDRRLSTHPRISSTVQVKIGTGLFNCVRPGVLANPSWGNSGSPDDIGRGTFNLGNFTRLLETGVYQENYPIFNSGNGGNELPNFNYPRAHQQSNEIYQNGEGFGNMPWVNKFAATRQGDAGPSDNVPCVQQFVEEYNSSPHLYASSDFQHPFNSIGHGIEPQAGYNNWEWMNNNNGNAGSSTNVFDADADADSEYSIPADEFYAEIGEDKLLVDLLTGNCIGAIDGTHVMIRCKKKEDEKRFFSRKGYATQNIMAICDFDLTFVFASAGWEGIYHDYSIFKRCVLDPRYCFPQPEPDEDPELEDRLDDRDDIVDDDNVPEMNDVRNNIRRTLHRL